MCIQIERFSFYILCFKCQKTVLNGHSLSCETKYAGPYILIFYWREIFPKTVHFIEMNQIPQYGEYLQHHPYHFQLSQPINSTHHFNDSFNFSNIVFNLPNIFLTQQKKKCHNCSTISF